MGSFCIVVDEEVSQSVVEEGFVVNDVQVVINELFLKGAVVAFDEGVDFRASGVREEMGDAVGLKLGMEFA